MVSWVQVLVIFLVIATCATIAFLVYRKSRKSATMQKAAVIAGLAYDYDLIAYLNEHKNTVTDILVSEKIRKIKDHINPSKPSNRRLDDLFKEIVHPDDFQQFLADVDRKRTMKLLLTEPSYTVRFRAVFDGVIQQYQIKIARDLNKSYGFVIGIRNIDAEIRREEETKKLKKELQTTMMLANRDSLTEVGSVSAFHQKVFEWDSMILKHRNQPFAVVECDLNDLKKVNDALGHEAGNEYLKANCSVFCSIYKHSPVFRVGGDEFVILLVGEDFNNRAALMEELKNRISTEKEISSKRISFAVGMCEFDHDIDAGLQDTLKRADQLMYKHKRKLKENG